MSTEVLVAIIVCIGTMTTAFCGTYAGVRKSNKHAEETAQITIYRLEQLEKKVDKHNNFAARMPVVEEQMRVANHRILNLEKE